MTKKMIKHEHNIEDELYSIRMLVFQEIEPQSNKYNQIIFTPEEFKRVSGTIGRVVSKSTGGSNRDVIEVMVSDEIYTLPDLPEIEEVINIEN